MPRQNIPLRHTDYFETKALEDAGRTVGPPSFYLKAGIKCPRRKAPSLYQEENSLIIRDWSHCGMDLCTNLLK